MSYLPPWSFLQVLLSGHPWDQTCKPERLALKLSLKVSDQSDMLVLEEVHGCWSLHPSPCRTPRSMTRPLPCTFTRTVCLGSVSFAIPAAISSAKPGLDKANPAFNKTTSKMELNVWMLWLSDSSYSARIALTQSYLLDLFVSGYLASWNIQDLHYSIWDTEQEHDPLSFWYLSYNALTPGLEWLMHSPLHFPSPT